MAKLFQKLSLDVHYKDVTYYDDQIPSGARFSVFDVGLNPRWPKTPVLSKQVIHNTLVAPTPTNSDLCSARKLHLPCSHNQVKQN